MAGFCEGLYGKRELADAEQRIVVAALQLPINRETLEAGALHHQQRFSINKPVGQPVPADTFLDERFGPISAIWATDIDEFSLASRIPPMAVVHNPHAVNPIPAGLLPAQDEYLVAKVDEQTYQVDRVDGLKRPLRS